MDVAKRCKIIRQTLFETGHGFAVAQAKDSNGFVVWQFTQTPFGRDFYHGRYFALRDDAERDFRRRTDNYKSINKTDRQSLQSPARYCRYYSTQRPVDIGTYPKKIIMDARRVVWKLHWDSFYRIPGQLFFFFKNAW